MFKLTTLRPTRALTVAIPLAAGTLFGALQFGCAYRPLPTAPAPSAPALEQAEDVAPRIAEEIIHEMVFDLVRTHRRSASERWCRTLTDAIVEESTLAGVDPLLVASIVARESSFKSRIVSSAGAVGLMQLRPFVARDVASRSDVSWRGVETLHDPALNVRLGILYYKELCERFDHDEETALTAYNYGPTRVSKMQRNGSYSGSKYAARIIGLYSELDEKRRHRASRNGGVTG